MSKLLQQYQATASSDHGSAVSLPFEVYRYPEVFALETENIFHNDWVFVCAERELAEAGDYLAMDLAGEAVVVLRGQDRKLRALSNICRHRGTPLLDEGFGQVGKLIVCPYHAWSYDNEGSLKAAPFSNKGELDMGEHCLPQFHLDTLLGLVFVSIADNPQPLQERFTGLADYCSALEPERFVHATPSTTETWEVNWKLAMENAMESYHLFKVHRETLEKVTPSKQAYYVAGSSEWTLTGGMMIDESGPLQKWLQGDVPEIYQHYLLVSLAPNFVGIMTWDSFGWLSTLPVAADKTVIRAGALVESGVEDEESKAFTEAFFAEDKWICERVQRGMRSRASQGGRLLEVERPVIDFHQYLSSRLFGTEPAAFYQNPEPNPFNQG